MYIISVKYYLNLTTTQNTHSRRELFIYKKVVIKPGAPNSYRCIHGMGQKILTGLSKLVHQVPPVPKPVNTPPMQGVVRGAYNYYRMNPEHTVSDITKVIGAGGVFMGVFLAHNEQRIRADRITLELRALELQQRQFDATHSLEVRKFESQELQRMHQEKVDVEIRAHIDPAMRYKLRGLAEAKIYQDELESQIAHLEKTKVENLAELEREKRLKQESEALAQLKSEKQDAVIEELRKGVKDAEAKNRNRGILKILKEYPATDL